jgi:hypothetical protein
MPSELLLALVLIPSMLFVYVVLTTFYGTTKAYLAISCVPLGYLLVICVFQLLLEFQHLSDEWWRGLALTIGWASLAQAGLGIGLLVRSLYKKEEIVSLLLATFVSVCPFVLRFVR